MAKRPITENRAYQEITPAHVEGRVDWRYCGKHHYFERRREATASVDGHTFDEARREFDRVAEAHHMCSPRLDMSNSADDAELWVVGWSLPYLTEVRSLLDGHERQTAARAIRDEMELARLKRERPDLF